MVDIDAIGKAIVQEIKKEIVRMQLIDLGTFLNSITYSVEGSTITFSSNVNYAQALEFGTYSFGNITKDTSPGWPASTAKGYKKKDLSPEDIATLPKGMVAFAPFRRVLYNKTLIKNIIRKANK